MMHYSLQPRDQKFVRGYQFLSFAKNIGKSISKSLNGKYSPKLLDHAKKSATDALKTSSKRVTQKTAEATGDLVGKTIDDRVTKVSKTLPQNNSEKITNEHDREIPKEIYVSPEEREGITDELRLR